MEPNPLPFELTDQEGKFLIQLARNTAKTYLETGKPPKVPVDTPKKLLEKTGVFVTINSVHGKHKNLRGCIGYPYPTNPLVQAVIDNAVNAATEDPRFEPVEKAELDHVVFEVSVLTPPEPVKVDNPQDLVKEVKVGEHGLIMERGFYRGLLLPQVPVEWGWCSKEFLRQCCVKAGLPPNSWLTEGTKVYRFSAIVFEEENPNGEVRRKSLSEP
jgi:uncharacterized protein (TIGR00296 family)